MYFALCKYLERRRAQGEEAARSRHLLVWDNNSTRVSTSRPRAADQASEATRTSYWFVPSLEKMSSWFSSNSRSVRAGDGAVRRACVGVLEAGSVDGRA